jgi:hypothetical protein
MDNTIIVIQTVLSLAFTAGGVAKLVIPYARYSAIPGVAWSKEFKPEHLRLLGVLEVGGGVGLLLPLLVPSLAALTPFAAVGVALYMAGAMATHLRRSEYPHMVGNLIVFLLPSLLIAYDKLVGIAA